MKLGDHVKVIDTMYSSDFLQVGATGVIVGKVEHGPFVIKLDNGPAPALIPNQWGGWAFFAQQLEVIQ